MDIKGIQRILSENPEFEVSKSAEQPASASGISEISDAVEIAENPQQQNLFTADFKTFELEKKYSGVRMQQGRVQTDADFNEQSSIDTHLEDGVVVAFEGGDMRESFVTGDLWNFTDRPPDQQKSSTDDSSSSRHPSDPDDKA